MTAGVSVLGTATQSPVTDVSAVSPPTDVSAATAVPEAGVLARRATPSERTEVELFSLAGHDGHLHQVNSAFERLLGLPPGGTEGRSLLEFVHPEDIPQIVEGFSLLERGAEEILLDNRFVLPDGALVHLQWVVRPLEGSDLWWAAGRDVTEFRRAVAAAVDLRTRLALAVGPSLAAMWDLDLWGRTLTWELEAAGVLGVTPEDAPATSADLLALVHPEDRAAVAEGVEQLRSHVDTIEVDFRFGEHAGLRYLRLRGRTVERDRRGRGRRAIGLVLDVSAEKALQQQMLTMVMSDALTGIPNRRSFDQTLRAELRRCSRGGLPLTVAMIDIDNFKRFNDTFGHLVGDDVLCTVSRALTAQFETGVGMLARFGGEEFAAVMPGVTDAAAPSVGELLALAVRGSRLRQAPTWALTVSVGTATWTPGNPPLKPAELLDRADRALYLAKGAGKDRAIHHSAGSAPSARSTGASAPGASVPGPGSTAPTGPALVGAACEAAGAVPR